MSMKTCETCKGTGQVEEPIKVGDIVTIKQWNCLGAVVGTDGIYWEVLPLTGKYRGQAPGGWSPRNLTVQHGHIHIDR